jgi:hypothetical protein
MYKIYYLYELGKQDIAKYIGCSKQKYLCKRKAQHIEKAINNNKKDLWIRSINYNIGIQLIEDNIETLETAQIREDFYINKFKATITNTTGAKSIPPYMAGHNYIKLPERFISELGTMPDYLLAKKYGVCKPKIRRERIKRKIISYADITGNNGQYKAGKEHTR